MDDVKGTGKRRAKERGAATTAETLRTFRALGLEGDAGRAVFKVGGKAVSAVDVARDTATWTTAAEGPARVVIDFNSRETLDGIGEGRLHPIVAGLQGRLAPAEGDKRFGLNVLLALRASAPAFAEGRA